MEHSDFAKLVQRSQELCANSDSIETTLRRLDFKIAYTTIGDAIDLLKTLKDDLKDFKKSVGRTYFVQKKTLQTIKKILETSDKHNCKNNKHTKETEKESGC